MTAKTTYEVRRTIEASAGTVWAALTDADRLARSGLGIMRLDGTIGPDARLMLWSELTPERAVAIKVAEFIPKRRMVWQGGMPFGLFKGARQFNLDETVGGTTCHMREDFSGLLASMITKSMPDLQPSFDKFADGLKQICERNPT
ncbi:MAG: hypothetical protein RLZ98_3776 [Pseudomonadota bacterium]|jgi:hypothetical protein